MIQCSRAPMPFLGLEVEHDPVQPVLGQRPEQVAAEQPQGVSPARPVDEALDQQNTIAGHEQDRRHRRVHARELVEQVGVEHPRRGLEDLAAAQAVQILCRTRCHALKIARRAPVSRPPRSSGAPVRCLSDRPRPAPQRPVVDRPPGPEPQAGDVPLPTLRQPPAIAQRAHADRPRGRHVPAPPRPHPLRARRPPTRAAAHPRRVAARHRPAPAERCAAARPPRSPDCFER